MDLFVVAIIASSLGNREMGLFLFLNDSTLTSYNPWFNSHECVMSQLYSSYLCNNYGCIHRETHLLDVITVSAK